MTNDKDDLDTICGWREIKVRLLDESTGLFVSETVKVRRLNIYQVQEYAGVFANQAKTVELFTGQPAQWVGKLDYDSVEEILTTGEELNDPILARFSARDGRFLEKLTQLNEGKKEWVRKLEAELNAFQLNRTEFMKESPGSRT